MEKNVRNFVIIAHVDHGKSTLADRLLETTGTVPKRLMKPQYLDQLELERERGITIKMAPVRMAYENESGKYVLNLIDTPGHSDFSYEVSRALAAVEGAVLLVDATQGVQAQTLANFENAKRAGLAVIGAVNKIDVAAPEQIASSLAEIATLLGVDPGKILHVSGKTGAGVPDLLERVVSEVPPPHAASGSSGTARALVFDSLYDEHKGVIAFVRLFSGRVLPQATGELLATGAVFKIKEIGRFSPAMKPCDELGSGDIGYVATGIKDPGKIKIGDTLAVRREGEACEALPGYREPQAVVFVSFYPEDPSEYDRLRQTLGYLRLNDAALRFESDMNEVLGRGFKGGFLGRLHFEIAADRLEREFNLKTVHSFPSVAYEVKTEQGWATVTNPRDFPDHPLAVKEPVAKIEILSLPEYLGAILQLKDVFRFYDIEVRTMGGKSIMDAKLPLAELVSDFDDKLKSASKGFASMSYEPIGYEDADVVKMDIFVAESLVPGLTRVVFSADAERVARTTVERLKDLLPGQQFSQAIQASVGGKIIARETIPAMRKLLGNFGKTGGDRTRKMKLWKKQKEGKKRLQERGTNEQVKIPASIFKELLKR